MSDVNETNAQQRDRSPAYPIIPLGQAFERLAQFNGHFKNSRARPGSIGAAWGITGKAYADRMAAALKYFGLLEYRGVGQDREVAVSDEGRKFLRAQQEDTKREVIRAAALRPKSIAKYWKEWGVDRPADAVCLDTLVLKDGFSEQGARDFLKVYESTITYAKLSSSDKMVELTADEGGENDEDIHDSEPQSDQNTGKSSVSRQKEIKIMAGERELTTGLLAKDASFRLIVTGKIGAKEIERLIAKLELDKEILAEPDEGDEPNESKP
jgi:hypothetical protein